MTDSPLDVLGMADVVSLTLFLYVVQDDHGGDKIHHLAWRNRAGISSGSTRKRWQRLSVNGLKAKAI